MDSLSSFATFGKLPVAPEYRRDPLFEDAWRAGEKLSLDEAAELALTW
jgi:hypothetical protein